MSVVIPVKDDARHLEVCLLSLSRQSRSPFEVIVVDNGSSDDSAEVARRFDATVIVEGIPGIAAAASCGYDHATGDVIARIDADSVVPTNWVETVTTRFADDSRVDAVTGSAFFTDGPVSWRGVAARAYLGAYFIGASAALTHLPVFGSNFAMRSAAWAAVRSEVHRSDTRIHDDFDLAFHLGTTHTIHYASDLRVGISMRPLLDGRGVVRTLRGVRTVAIHWPDDVPWLRLARRIAIRRRERKGHPATWTPGDEFRAALILDAANVVGLTASAAWHSRNAVLGAKRSNRDRWTIAAVGASSWLAAAAADRLRVSQNASDGNEDGLHGAQRLVRLGMCVNTLGSAASILSAATRPMGQRGALVPAIYLLAGGLVVSLTYLRALSRITL